MFIFMQNRRDIIGSFSIKTFRRDDENRILAITEFETETEPAKYQVLGEYPNEADAKSVMKLIFADMKRREHVFKMPKKDGVAKVLKAAVERAALIKKQAAEREARRVANEKLAEERRQAKEAKAAAHEKLLAEQAAAKAKRIADRAAAAAARAEKTEEQAVPTVNTPEED